MSKSEFFEIANLISAFKGQIRKDLNAISDQIDQVRSQCNSLSRRLDALEESHKSDMVERDEFIKEDFNEINIEMNMLTERINDLQKQLNK